MPSSNFCSGPTNHKDPPFPEGISGFDDDGRSQLFYIKLGQSHLWKHVTEACLRIERCRAAVAGISSREDDDSRNGVFILSGSTGNKGHESFWSYVWQ